MTVRDAKLCTVVGESDASDYRDEITPKRHTTIARELRTWRRRISYLRFPRKPLRGAVKGMTLPACSIGSGAQIWPVDQSMHMVGRGVRSRTISASLLCSFSLISRVMQRVTSITSLIITRTRFG